MAGELMAQGILSGAEIAGIVRLSTATVYRVSRELGLDKNQCFAKAVKDKLAAMRKANPVLLQKEAAEQLGISRATVGKYWHHDKG